ncbi:MAG: hypothetical protein JXM69_21255 [Anaerolineae bacterium]|nr:hypothetical protein [Anaerolineae bacterium]
MKIDYLFRKPKFPVICSIGDILITAKSEAEFQRRIDKVNLTPDMSYNIVDSTGEGWEFYTNKLYIIPALRRKWSKKRLIQTYNDSQNCQSAGITYSEKSLSSKRFEKVFADIVALVEQSQ